MHHLASRPPRLALPLLALILAVALTACSSGISSRSTATKPPPAPAPAVETPAPAPAPPEPAAAPVAPVAQEPVAPPAPPVQKPYATAALLLPLTGPAAATGSALFNAAQLALFEVADRKFTLLPYDTKGTAEGAESAVQQALASNPDIILGPLFSAEVKAAEPRARDAHVPMIALSADRMVAGAGVYVLGFLPGPQALRVIAFAARRGNRRLAVLAPSTEYGQRVVEEVVNGAPSLGVTVTNPQFYDESATDISAPVKHLLKFDAAVPGDPGFDALLIPDEGARLRQVSSALPLLGIDPVRVKLLGTMLWDDSSPGNEPTLAGGWYPAPPAANHLAFQDRYNKAFGSRPPRIASLAYDATALAAVLARHEPRDFSATALTNRSGFAGVDGLFRLQPDGTVDRGYAIEEVVNSGAAREIDPPPTNFANPTN